MMVYSGGMKTKCICGQTAKFKITEHAIDGKEPEYIVTYVCLEQFLEWVSNHLAIEGEDSFEEL